MIDFSDITMVEGRGIFSEICQIMLKDGDADWMLRTDAVVSTKAVITKFILHLWSNGEIFIVDTERPTIIDVPEDDIRELSEWCVAAGWTRLCVHTDLLDDPQAYVFWLRQYRTGIVQSDVLAEAEVEEIKRFDKAYGGG